MSTSGLDPWLGSGDKWPEHEDSWFQDLLSKAREQGWWFKKPGKSAHNFGMVYCTRPNELDKPCKYVIFSTGKGGESASDELRRLIQRCPHRDSVDHLAVAIERLDLVENLLRAANALLDQREHAQQMDTLLDRAAELAAIAEEEIDALLSAATEHEGEYRAAGNDAARALSSAATEMQDPEKLAGLADEAARQARDDLLSVDPPNRARAAKARLRDLRAQLHALRARLSSI